MSEPRWLSDSEQWAWRAYNAATKLVNERLDRQLQRDSGMPMTYFESLVALSEAPDRTLRMSELAYRGGFSRSRLSHAVARLEQAGWVERRECPSDKRGAFAVLTEDGFAAIADAASGHVEQVRKMLFDVLTAEQVDRLGEICATIREAGQQAGRDPFGTGWTA